MKFIHLSDLHLGKKVNEISMLEDQRYILSRILAVVDAEEPDGILVAGDVYDRTIPSTEAMELLEQFLYAMAAQKRQVFVISGNHDSAERLSFGGRLMEKSGVHIAPQYRGTASVYTLQDEFGEVKIYMLPFIKPAGIRHALIGQNRYGN